MEQKKTYIISLVSNVVKHIPSKTIEIENLAKKKYNID